MYSYFVSELDSGLQRPQPTVFCGYAAVSHEFIKELFFLHSDVVQCHHVVLYGKGCFGLQLLVVRHTLLFSLSKKAIFQIAISFFSLVHPLVEVRTPPGCTHHTLVIPTLKRSLKKHTQEKQERENTTEGSIAADNTVLTQLTLYTCSSRIRITGDYICSTGYCTSTG